MAARCYAGAIDAVLLLYALMGICPVSCASSHVIVVAQRAGAEVLRSCVSYRVVKRSFPELRLSLSDARDNWSR
jgi:hypothetical protein